MYILTFDTALDKTYVALFNDSAKVFTEIIESTEDKYHSAFLIQNLVDLLKEHSLTLKDIGVIGVNIGPGSFTGIRACLTIARVIAQQLNCPLVGVPSLEILSRINKKDLPVVVTMDARKGMCYYSEYSKDGLTIQEPRLELIETAVFDNNKNVIIADEVMHSLLKNKGIESICYRETNSDLGCYLAEIVVNKIKNCDDYNWASVKPLYLQKPSITVSKKTLL